MALITSAILMCKGALFLAKSAAVKTALAKYGAYMVTTYGIGATVATAATVSTAAGVFVVAKSIPQNASDGFILIVRSFKDGSPTDFCEGLYKAAKAYTKAATFMDDFDSFVDGFQGEPEIKVSLKRTMNDLESMVKNQIEGETFSLMRDVENLLRSRGISVNDFQNEIQKVYMKHTLDLNLSNSYFEILGRCGRIYSDLSALNQKYGVSTNIGEYDHYLAYCIAGWMKDNKTNLSSIRNKSQKELAHDITNQILDYLHAYSLG